MGFDIDNPKLFTEDKLPTIDKEFLDSIYVKKESSRKESYPGRYFGYDEWPFDEEDVNLLENYF